MSYRNVFEKLKKTRFFTYGVPFFVLVIGGSFALKNFSRVRYDYRTQKQVSRADLLAEGLVMKSGSESTIEKAFEEMKTMDIDHWVNKRGPRPWEEDNEAMKEIKERAAKKEVMNKRL